jgi:hypothetical protein
MSLKSATQNHYVENKEDWILARDFFALSNLESYLKQGKYEADGPFLSRVSRSFAQNHTSDLVGRLTDPLLIRSNEVERDLGPISDSYFENAGPNDETHDIQMHGLSEYLMLYGEAWVEVRPSQDVANLRIRSPLSVPRWKDQKVLTLGEAEKPNVPINQKQEVDTTYTVHTPTGYATYMFEEKENGEDERIEIDSGTYAPTEDEAFFVDTEGEPTPPLFRIEMPWDSVFGISVARVHRAIYRMRNELHGKFGSILTNSRYYTKGLDSDGERKVIHALKQGHNLLHLDEDSEIKALEVPTDGIEETQEELGRLKEDLYDAARQSINGASSNASATEMAVRNQDRTAAVSTLAATVESAEESILRLVSQAQNIVDFGGPNPQDPQVSSDWTSIDWSESGVSLRPNNTNDLIRQVFPSGIPLDAESATSVLVKHLKDNGYSDIDRESVREQVELALDRGEQDPTNERLV